MNGSLFRLWLTCRVIANENRLRLLWLIFSDPSLCVGELAEKVNLTPATVSNQLKILCDEGMITPHRSRLTVRYQAGSQYAPAHIQSLLGALKKCCDSSVPLHAIFHQATGFTHQRRIELMRRIAQTPSSMDELATTMIMSPPALARHLRKLEARSYIVLCDKRYGIGNPTGYLAKVLLKLLVK